MRRALVSFGAAALLVLSSGATARADTLLDFDNAVSALAAFAPDLAPPPSSPNKDFVVGGFESAAFQGWNNGLSVHSGPAGENVQGHASATNPTLGWKIREDAVCLAVQGNLAAIGFRGTFNALPGEVYEEIVVVRDGGPGGTLDGFNAFLPFELGVSSPEDCAAGLPLALVAPPLERGNILVNDAP